MPAFATAANAFPWQWMRQMLDEWLGNLPSIRHVKRTTVPSYRDAVRSFCQYVTDPAYDWADVTFGDSCHQMGAATSDGRPDAPNSTGAVGLTGLRRDDQA